MDDPLDAALPGLDGLAPHRQELFALRTRRWWPDLVDGLRGVYADPEAVGRRLLALAARAYAARPDDLHVLDLQRSLEPDWFQRPDVVGYAAYTERFSPDGTLAGVASRVPHLRSLQVRYLHLMPLLEPRPAPNDGGYAVADYRAVRSDLGTVDDLVALTGRLRESGISLCLDLVLNHVAREHEWAVAARDGDERYRAYFHVFGDRELPDAYEQTLPEVFPDFAPGSFTHDDDLGGWVWTTFNSWQWDLDWSNPDVLAEMADVVLFLANLGVEVLRLDAIAFIWKRLGTNSQNQPEVHGITQALKAVTRIATPALLLKAEAIVSPGDLVHYLGQGRHAGRVSDLAYHNSLMVQSWSMLAARDAGLAAEALGAVPPVPSTTAWITYVRCHDDIGWAIDDADAAAVGVNGFDHRSFLSDFYSGTHEGSFADGLVFQANPQTGDRRISGTTASLAGLGRALLHDDGPATDDAVARILLSHALVMGWGGVPVLWSGDEVAALNDEGWRDQPGHDEDNRWAHRPRLDDAALAVAAADPTSPQGRVLAGLRRLAGVRAVLPHVHAAVASEAVPTPDRGVLGVLRRHPLGLMIGLYNVTETWGGVPDWWLSEQGLEIDDLHDHLAGGPPERDDHAVLLPPYRAVWLTARPT